MYIDFINKPNSIKLKIEIFNAMLWNQHLSRENFTCCPCAFLYLFFDVTIIVQGVKGIVCEYTTPTFFKEIYISDNVYDKPEQNPF